MGQRIALQQQQGRAIAAVAQMDACAAGLDVFLGVRGRQGQTWKLSPQPQRPFSFGLTNVNPDVNALVS